MAVPALELRPRSPVLLFDAAIRVCARSSGVWALTLPGGALVTWAVLSLAGSVVRGEALLVPAVMLTLAWLARAVLQGAACHYLDQQIVGAEAPSTWRSLHAALGRVPSLFIAAGYLFFFNAFSLALTFGFGFFLLASHVVAYAVTMKGRGHPLALYATCSRLLGSARGHAPVVRLLFLAVVLVGLNLHLGANAAVYLGRKLLGLDLTYAQRFASLDNGAWMAAVAALSFALLEPLRAAVATLLLVDARVRQEGLDLLAAVEQLPRRKPAERTSRTSSARVAAIGLALAASIAASPVLAAGRSIVARARELARACECDPGELGTADDLARLPATEQAAVERFVAGLERVSEEEDCEAVAAQLETGLPLVRGALNHAPVEAPGAPAARAQEILSRAEFAVAPERAKANSEQHESFFERWLRRLLEWLRDYKPDPERPEPRGGGMSVAGTIALLLVALAMLVVLALLFSVFRNRSKPLAASGVEAESDPSSSGDPGALAHAPEGWASIADDLARQGRFREAVRNLYLALLSQLHRIGAIDYDPASSNWDYCRQFRGRREWAPAFRDLTLRFDFAWYGRSPIDAEAYAAFRSMTWPILVPGEDTAGSSRFGVERG